MKTLLPALRDYLKSNLVPTDGKITPERPIRTCECRPNAWIVANRSSAAFPGVFLWGGSETRIPGRFSDTLTQVLRVQVTIFHQSTDPNMANFGSLQGIYPVSDRVCQLLGENKEARDSSGNATVTGLNLPINAVDGQLITPDPYTFHGVSRDIALEYIREGVPWHWLTNDETQNFDFR